MFFLTICFLWKSINLLIEDLTRYDSCLSLSSDYSVAGLQVQEQFAAAGLDWRLRETAEQHWPRIQCQVRRNTVNVVCAVCCLLQWLSQHTWENVPSILCLSHLCLCLSNLMNCWMTLTSLPCQYWGVLDQIWGSCDFGVSLSGTQQQHTHYQVRFKWAHTDMHTLDTYLHSL